MLRHGPATQRVFLVPRDVGCGCRRLMDRLESGGLDPFGEMKPGSRLMKAREYWLAARFRSQVVDVRGVSKGMRTGGIRRLSAIVVAGNYDVTPLTVWPSTLCCASMLCVHRGSISLGAVRHAARLGG